MLRCCIKLYWHCAQMTMNLISAPSFFACSQTHLGGHLFFSFTSLHVLSSIQLQSNRVWFSCVWCNSLFFSKHTNATHRTRSAGEPPQSQNMYPTGRHLSSPLWLADLGVARTDLKQTGCYSSYVDVLVWPNKLRETIPAAGVSRKDHLPEWHDPSNYLNSVDCDWVSTHTHTDTHTNRE